jgi:hypothetical protein
MNKEDNIILALTKEVSYEDILMNWESDLPDDNSICQSGGCSYDKLSESHTEIDETKSKLIKQRVINQIKNKKRLWVKGVMAASLALFFLMLALSPVGQKTLAGIIEKLNFIPGAGQASVDSDGDVYILSKPIEYQYENGEITIHSITKRSDAITMYATGNIPLHSGEISMKANGTEYTCNNYSVGVGENITAEYHFIIPDENENFSIEINHNYSIPIKLVRAESFEDYEEMGPTCFSNDFGLTLVPLKLDNKIRFDVLQHNTNNGEVNLYGSCDKEGNNSMKIKVYDDKGQSCPVEYPKSYMGTQSTFVFTPSDIKMKYTVEIPEVTLQYKLDNKITLPLPAQGETNINQTVDLQGFKLRITKISRKDDLVTVYVDTSYNADNPENICYFMMDMEKMSLNYYHWIMNDQITTEGVEFNINPDTKKITLHFKELYTILKGPWKFNLSEN